MGFILIGVIIFLILPRSGKQEFLELGLILVIALATEVVTTTGVLVFKANMNIVPNIWDIINFPLAVLFYRKRFHWEKKNRFATIIIIAFVFLTLINLIFIQGAFNYNGYSSAFASVCFIVISLTYFYVLIQQLPTESITKLPMFWINTAVLIFYSGTFLLFLTADYLIKVLNNNLVEFWMIHHYIGLIFYSILSYALLLVRAQHKNKVAFSS